MLAEFALLLRVLTGTIMILCRRILLFAVALGGVTVPLAPAQPRFDAASVKSAVAEVPMGLTKGGPGTEDPNRIVYTRVTLHDVVLIAYDLTEDFQYSVPKWMTDSRFDIEATIPPGTSKGDFRLMLQGLLRERFALKSHVERRELSGWRMTVAKGGAKLHEAIAATASGPPGEGLGLVKDEVGLLQLPPGRKNIAGFMLRDRRMRVSGRLQTASEIATDFQRFVHGPIVDETGMPGSYDFNIDFVSDFIQLPAGQVVRDSNGDPAPDVVTALAQQLGLKLTAARIPVDVLVVDSAARTPTEN